MEDFKVAKFRLVMTLWDSRQQNYGSWDPDKDRKEMVSKNIS